MTYHLQPFIEKLTRDIVWKITQNEYGPREQLPSIEEMAKQYGVARSTIREALKHLQSCGLIYSQHGKGTFLLNFKVSEHGGNVILEEILDLRRMLEIHAMKKAVQTRTDQDIARLQQLLNEMEQCITSPVRFTDTDRQFHISIAEASKNPFLPSMYHNISGLFAGLQDAIFQVKGSPEKALYEHQVMLRALVGRDESLALDVMNNHLDSIVKQIRERRV
ncbi:GntR family transcriptional repressor for pyruvate dehydrogenase complex [Ammoniphilus resinae]|uniref:GntR family transcriptional repressor for pyruvate dehydrogenase complex n=2 Tax=Ammoniphilus resinae TaxID=861532 RepID=A0ABS4GWB1_9BACL|nr:GntR family transcriptional repressor for pyruvate dehydrogenase complex [Ammoniphilus resinae]